MLIRRIVSFYRHFFNLPRSFRLGLIFFALVLSLFSLWESDLHSRAPEGDAPAVFYAHECNDDLRKVITNALKGADHSIFLQIYALTDRKIIQLLRTRAEEGLQVTVIYDEDATPKEMVQLLGGKVKKIKDAETGLMHRKVLVIDEEEVFVGSANFTYASFVFHNNLIVGCVNPSLAKSILRPHLFHSHIFALGEQTMEYWMLPQESPQALNRLLTLLQAARVSLFCAMYTWTHPQLTQAVIAAKERGVDVEVILDEGQSKGANRTCVTSLALAGVPVRIATHSDLLHHKYALIDGTTLVHGSANWTRAAFGKNREALLILFDLVPEQREKMAQMQRALRALSIPYSQFLEAA